MAYLKEIEPAEELVLIGPYVTDKGLQSAVACQPEVRKVWIWCIKITESGLSCLSELKNLESLRVNKRLQNAPVLELLRKRGVEIQIVH